MIVFVVQLVISHLLKNPGRVRDTVHLKKLLCWGWSFPMSELAFFWHIGYILDTVLALYVEHYSVTWPGNDQLRFSVSSGAWHVWRGVDISLWNRRLGAWWLWIGVQHPWGLWGHHLDWLMGPWGQVSGRPVTGNFIRFSWLAKDVNGCRSNISTSRVEGSFITAWVWPVKHSRKYWAHLSDINQHVSHLPLSDLVSLRAFHLVEHCNVMRSRAEHGPLAITHSSEPFTQTGQFIPSLHHRN